MPKPSLYSPILISIFILFRSSHSFAGAIEAGSYKDANRTERFFADDVEEDTAIPSMHKILADPANTHAIQELKKVFTDLDDWSSSERLHLSRFIDIADYCNFLILRINYLSKNNLLLHAFILKNSSHDVQLVESANEVYLQSQKLTEKSTTDVSAGDKAYVSGKIFLNDATEALLQKRDDFLQKLEYMQMSNRDLRNLKREVISNISSKKEQQRSSNINSQIDEIKKHLQEKNKALISQENDLLKFNQQLQMVQLKFEMVQQRLKQTDKKIIELTRDLAGVSLEAYAKNKVIADHDEFIEELKNVVTDTRERLNLVQRIIQEKDNHIQELEKEVFGLQTVVSNETDPESITILKNDMSDLHAQLQAQFESSRSQIARLEQKMKDINDQYAEIKLLVKVKENEISQLRETAIVKDSKIKTFNKVFALKDNKLIELKGIVQIYKEKLTDTTSDLKSNEEKLIYLQTVIDDMARQFEKLAGINKIEGGGLSSEKKLDWLGPIETLTHHKILEKTIDEIKRLKNGSSIF